MRKRVTGKAVERGASPQLIRTWYNIHSRCYYERHDFYKNYGGRGITVDPRWHRENPDGLLNFFLDMGNPPPKHSINRIDNDGHYTPSNCEWVLSTTQSQNRRKFAALENHSVEELANHIRKMDPETLLLLVTTVIKAPDE